MKVLLINQVFYPDTVATAQHVTDLALGLARRGCEVTVVAGQRGYENRRVKYPKRENYQGVIIHRVSCTGLGKSSLWRRIIDSLSFQVALCFKLVVFRSQDVIIGFTSPPLVGFIGCFHALMRGTRYIQWLMDVNPDAALAVGYVKSDSVTAKFLAGVLNFNLRHSNRVIVLDRWMKKRISEKGVSIEKISIVPPWPVHEAPESKQPAPKAENPFCVEHNLVDKFIILYSGNHSIVHPLETLLNAAKKLSGDPRFQFVFVGDGLRKNEVSGFKAKWNLSNITQLPLQPRNQLKHSLSCADVHIVVLGDKVSGLVHASKIYGVLQTGAPFIFIGPKESHLSDVIDAGCNGIQIDSGDFEGVVSALRLLSNQSAENVSAAYKFNRSFVQNNYSASHVIDLFAKEVLDLPDIPPLVDVLSPHSA